MTRASALWFGAVAAVGLLAWQPRVEAEEATVYRTSGPPLMGDVTVEEDEVIVTNTLGAVRIPRAAVTRIEWRQAADSVAEDFARRLSMIAPEDADGFLALAEWARDRRQWPLVRQASERVLAVRPGDERAQQLLRFAAAALPKDLEATSKPASQPATGPAAGPMANAAPAAEPPEDREIPVPPLLGEADINRIKLHEIRREGPLERVGVRFSRVEGERLEAAVLRELQRMDGYNDQWRRVMIRGDAAEKLRLLLRLTGTQFYDAIEVRGDPEVFQVFRREVLPRVVRGCVRSGCHAGDPDHGFRWPEGRISDAEYAYTIFYFLDQMETQHGPMLNRMRPDDSALLGFLLPADGNPRPHPVVEGDPIRPILRGSGPQYRDYNRLANWINALRFPHPAYGVGYQLPAGVPSRPPPFDLSAPAGEDN